MEERIPTAQLEPALFSLSLKPEALLKRTPSLWRVEEAEPRAWAPQEARVEEVELLKAPVREEQVVVQVARQPHVTALNA